MLDVPHRTVTSRVNKMNWIIRYHQPCCGFERFKHVSPETERWRQRRGPEWAKDPPLQVSKPSCGAEASCSGCFAWDAIIGPKTTGQDDDGEAAGGKRKAAAPVESAKNPESSAGARCCHWLMKSEPESRFENGIDVKVRSPTCAARLLSFSWTRVGLNLSDAPGVALQFGIEELKALPDQTGCWDGVRNYQVDPWIGIL